MEASAQLSSGERADADWRFAVIDLETTGLEPGADRVIECAIVEVDARGAVLDEFSTLIAIPGEDEPGAQFVHGISRPMLDGAPTFGAIADQIIARLVGRIVVGHVVAFDLAHLAAEFARLAVRMPDLGAASLCTRELMLASVAEGSRSLRGCCARAGITVAHAHTALGDARTTARLMGWALANADGIDLEARANAARQPWPTGPSVTQATLRPRALSPD